MKKYILAASILVAGVAVASAQGGGGMTGGSGMLVVADDGSLLVTQMGLSGGMMGGGGTLDRDLVNIGPDGQERWRATFDEGWPMRPASDGDLVVLTLADDWWLGGGTGDGGWNHGGMGGGGTPPGGDGDGHATLVALRLTTGQELWRLELEGDMISMPQFTEDGSRLYLTVRDMNAGQVGGGPMNQGDAPGAGMLMTSTVVAVNRAGTVLWTLDLDDGHMGGPVAGGGS